MKKNVKKLGIDKITHMQYVWQSLHIFNLQIYKVYLSTEEKCREKKKYSCLSMPIKIYIYTIKRSEINLFKRRAIPW